MAERSPFDLTCLEGISAVNVSWEMLPNHHVLDVISTSNRLLKPSINIMKFWQLSFCQGAEQAIPPTPHPDMMSGPSMSYE